jgi:hypothetical protein
MESLVNITFVSVHNSTRNPMERTYSQCNARIGLRQVRRSAADEGADWGKSELSSCCLFFGPPHGNKTAICTPLRSAYFWLRKNHILSTYVYTTSECNFPGEAHLAVPFHAVAHRRRQPPFIFNIKDAGAKPPHPPTLKQCEHLLVVMPGLIRHPEVWL